jgi:hypothetical protein
MTTPMANRPITESVPTIAETTLNSASPANPVANANSSPSPLAKVPLDGGDAGQGDDLQDLETILENLLLSSAQSEPSADVAVQDAVWAAVVGDEGATAEMSPSLTSS